MAFSHSIKLLIAIDDVFRTSFYEWFGFKTSVGSSYSSYHDVENEIYHPHWVSFYALVKLSELFMSFAKCLSTLNSLRSVQFFRSGFWRISYSKPTKDVFPLPIFIGKYVRNLFPRKQVSNFLNFNFVKHIRNDMHIFLNSNLLSIDFHALWKTSSFVWKGMCQYTYSRYGKRSLWLSKVSN